MDNDTKGYEIMNDVTDNDMEQKLVSLIILLILLFIVLLFFVFAFGFDAGIQNERKRAVASDVAYYSVDKTTGKLKFNYGENTVE